MNVDLVTWLLYEVVICIRTNQSLRLTKDLFPFLCKKRLSSKTLHSNDQIVLKAESIAAVYSYQSESIYAKNRF